MSNRSIFERKNIGIFTTKILSVKTVLGAIVIMMDRAIYASITELNCLPVEKDLKTKKQKMKQKITAKKIKQKWQKNLANLIRAFTAGLFLF